MRTLKSIIAEPALTLGRVGSLPRDEGLRGPPNTKKGASAGADLGGFLGFPETPSEIVHASTI